MSSGKWRTGTIVAAACVALCLLIGAVLLFSTREGRAAGLTMEEARGEVLKQYGGEIIGSSAQDGGYLVELRTEQGIYEVTVGGARGSVDSIRLLERFTGDEGTGVEPGNSPSETAKPSDSGSEASPVPSSTPAATPIATPSPSGTGGAGKPPTSSPNGAGATTKPPTRTPGGKPSSTSSVHITEEQAASLALAKVAGTVTDVDKDDDNGVWYYYVDIETNDGREAEVQLNAASGAIVSVAWDDDDDDD
ncbi:PepSY domain-containing protein [Paenibacillus agaridevorans]|uniref:PepSY domain-containing protein n=1 Tax=Paenibacillus agaridevorans TaxID=171404 RepID=UPI001BE402E0|nr:PepSY domain-containing protein [Paenibacillus agaridevorans]